MTFTIPADMPVGASVMTAEGAPRIGPSLSTYSLVGEAYDAAESAGLNLYPWQGYALDVAMSINADGKFKYREVAIIASRQNGKSQILIPRIVWALNNGRRLIHTAQNRLLPRKVFEQVALLYPDAKVRYANGQEEIRTAEGGRYMIVAPQRGARGESADDLIVDELREMEDFDFIAAAEPTLSASDNPQVLYLSNAGTEKSLVLNDLKARAGKDDGLAYMEWSASPERDAEDRDGWLEANPSIGHGNLTIERLASLFHKYKTAGELAVFETEHLCRWVKSMRPRLVADADWQKGRSELETPSYPALGIAVDSSGHRASAYLAWQQSDGTIAVTVAGDVTGTPVDVLAFAEQLDLLVKPFGLAGVGFDPWTDQQLARYFPEAKPITGAEYANASERFVRAVETGQLKWQRAEELSADLPYASRKPAADGRAWTADPSHPDRSIAAVRAAIRAVWIASAPTQKPTVY